MLPVFLMKLVSQNADLVLSDLGDQVDQPNNKVTEAGQQTNQAYDQSDDVLGLGKADDAVDTTDNVTQENLNQDLILGSSSYILVMGLFMYSSPFLSLG